MLAAGDLGDGNDVLDVGGTLDAGGGNFILGAGDDTFVIHDGTTSSALSLAAPASTRASTISPL